MNSGEMKELRIWLIKCRNYAASVTRLTAKGSKQAMLDIEKADAKIEEIDAILDEPVMSE